MRSMVVNQAQVARWFHALSDETRLGILERLRGGERCVCELQDSLDAAQSRLSFHLGVLREAGLVDDRRQGRWNFYSLRRDVLEEMAEYLRERTPDESVGSACGDDEADPGQCCA